MLNVKPNVQKFIELLTEKDRRIVGEHISRLEGDWPPGGDLEKLYDHRVNVGLIFPNRVGISFPTPLKSIVNFLSNIWKPLFC